MKIVMVSPVLNIHQAEVAKELYKLTNGSYWFVQTDTNDKADKKGGKKDYSSDPYLIIVSDKESMALSMEKVQDADVLLYDGAPIVYLKERIKTDKLTFLLSERWLKRGLINLLSPRLLAQQWFYHTHCHNKPVYALCASAYAAGDFAKMFSFRGKCYKWGYFTSTNSYDGENDDDNLNDNNRTNKARILWCGRFIGWKHPEVMIDLAKRLKEAGVDFEINMIGTGVLKDPIDKEIQAQGLSGHIHLLGSLPNEEVIKAMREHHLACFTSDRNEGWGAVLNEAMSQGCCPVSSIETGSTPYLIKDGVNGFSFSLKKKDDLFEKVMYLIEHPKEREKMSIEAYKTIRDVWSPKNAAKNLYTLCEALLNNKETGIKEGPCSKA